MKQLPRMRFVFNRRGNATEEKQTTVELEIYFSRAERKFVPTDVMLRTGQWDANGKVVNHAQKDAMNKQLDALRLKYERLLTAMEVDGIDFNMDNFNERIGKPKRIEKQEEKYTSFLDFMYDRIGDRNLRDSTKRMHLVAWETLKRFGGIKSFDSLTPKNLKLFDDFLRKENPDRKQTTLHGYHKRIKPYVIEALNLEYIKTNPYNQFNDIRGAGKEREPLNQEELNLIRSAELPEKLERVRDIFVFGCFTGMSYSDISLFRYDRDVVQSKGMYYIDGERLKTGTKFYTPLLRPAMDVLTKYKYKLPIVSIQKYNDFLHVIEARLNIRKPLSSHIARHTFATTVTLANDIPIESVSRMLGHKDIKTTQIYAKILKTTIERQVEGLFKIV